MEINQYEKNSVVILELEGKLIGGPDAMNLNDLLHRLIEQEMKKIVVDVGKINWINSSGLGILTGSLANLRNNGGDLKLANLTERIGHLFKITKLLTIFETFDSVDKAIESYQ